MILYLYFFFSCVAAIRSIKSDLTAWMWSNTSDPYAEEQRRVKSVDTDCESVPTGYFSVPHRFPEPVFCLPFDPRGCPIEEWEKVGPC